jgi:hypothetical protein
VGGREVTVEVGREFLVGDTLGTLGGALSVTACFEMTGVFWIARFENTGGLGGCSIIALILIL